MKNLTLVYIYLLLNIISFGQNKVVAPEKRNGKFNYEKPVRATLKTNPMAFMVGPIMFTSEFRIAFEVKMAKKQSFQFGVSYLGKSFYTKMIENNNQSMTLNNVKLLINGYRLQLTYKWYLDYHDAPKGFFIAPHLSYSYAKFTTNHNNPYAEFLEAKYINYCLLGGYQLVVNDIFVLEAYSGFGYKNNMWYETYGGQTISYTDDDFVIFKGDLKIVLGLNLGIAF